MKRRAVAVSMLTKMRIGIMDYEYAINCKELKAHLSNEEYEALSVMMQGIHEVLDGTIQRNHSILRWIKQ